MNHSKYYAMFSKRAPESGSAQRKAIFAAVKIVIFCIGEPRSAFIREGIEDYTARIKHYAPIETVAISEKKHWRKLPPEERKKAEGEAILAELQPGDRAVLLDEKGVAVTSRAFAKKLEQHLASGGKRLVFIVGGAFGFSREVYAAVQPKMALSAMTFNHEMALFFLTEQLYRAFSILNNGPYHND